MSNLKVVFKLKGILVIKIIRNEPLAVITLDEIMYNAFKEHPEIISVTQIK